MATILHTKQGGTGTATVPDEGQVLVADTNGNYQPSSSLDILKISKLYTPDGTNAFVYTDNDKNLHINGNIYAIYDIHAEEVWSENEFIKLRDGATTAIPAGEISGIEVLKYDGTNSLVFGTDSDGYFKVGETG
ncbi:MAG: hypothetical protein EOL97_16360, partial [Spirochaetia bacterium]|nr:hypothetical protein [Spirochaetia bacterium]